MSSYTITYIHTYMLNKLTWLPALKYNKIHGSGISTQSRDSTGSVPPATIRSLV